MWRSALFLCILFGRTILRRRGAGVIQGMRGGGRGRLVIEGIFLLLLFLWHGSLDRGIRTGVFFDDSWTWTVSSAGLLGGVRCGALGVGWLRIGSTAPVGCLSARRCLSRMLRRLLSLLLLFCGRLHTRAFPACCPQVYTAVSSYSFLTAYDGGFTSLYFLHPPLLPASPTRLAFVNSIHTAWWGRIIGYSKGRVVVRNVSRNACEARLERSCLEWDA